MLANKEHIHRQIADFDYFSSFTHRLQMNQEFIDIASPQTLSYHQNHYL